MLETIQTPRVGGLCVHPDPNSLTLALLRGSNYSSLCVFVFVHV